MSANAVTTSSLPEARTPRNPISRRQVENAATLSVAAFGVVFGAQAIPWLLGQLDEAYPLWLWIVVPALFGTLGVIFVLSIFRVWVRQAMSLFVIFFLLAMLTWPFTELPGAEIFTGIHWLNYLITIAVAMATIAFSTAVATAYMAFVSGIWFVVRVTPQGGGASWQLAALETVYGIILAGAIIIIITMLRQAATTVDSAQAAALDRYGRAVRHHAVEVERVQVDSIVHDSVLTTLLSAARATTPEAKALAASMAGSAIGHLREAALARPEGTESVHLAALAARISDTATTLPVPFELRMRNIGPFSIPVQAADAVYSAAVQSMVNSSDHAGEHGLRRWVAMRGVAPGGIEVIVGDTGTGFDLAEVPHERLGVRVSIIERVANAGGRAFIRTAPGEGTIVSIRWPLVEAAAEQAEEAL